MVYDAWMAKALPPVISQFLSPTGAECEPSTEGMMARGMGVLSVSVSVSVSVHTCHALHSNT